MSGHNYLVKMLDMLTGAYNREDVRNARIGAVPETNIGKLFSVFAWGLELVHEQSDNVLLWDDLDNASGKVLDRYGANFGVSRDGSSDDFYRLLIKVKMVSMLTGGDVNTVINAAAALFSIDPARVTLSEVFPAKVWIYIDEDALSDMQLEIVDLVAKVTKRIIATGVGMRLFLCAKHTFNHSIYVGAAMAYSVKMTINPAG